MKKCLLFHCANEIPGILKTIVFDLKEIIPLSLVLFDLKQMIDCCTAASLKPFPKWISKKCTAWHGDWCGKAGCLFFDAGWLVFESGTKCRTRRRLGTPINVRRFDECIADWWNLEGVRRVGCVACPQILFTWAWVKPLSLYVKTEEKHWRGFDDLHRSYFFK